MGKKKNRAEKPTTAGAKRQEPETKAQKNYSVATTAKDNNEDFILKVSLPPKKEANILELIHENMQQQQKKGAASQRLTSKKLTDLYMCLSKAGFKHGQIEQAMSATIQYGGDLIDALDWLCLNMANDQLPEKFSQALIEEEERQKKSRPTFAEVQEKLSLQNNEQHRIPAQALNQEKKAPSEKTQKMSLKEWILQSQAMSSDEDDTPDAWDKDGDAERDDPNSKYLETAAKLLDARGEAVQAKLAGDKSKQKSLSKLIRQYMTEIDELEKHPSFNPSVRIDLEEESAKIERKTGPAPAPASTPPEKKSDTADNDDDSLEGGAFALFEAAADFKEEPKKTVTKPKLEKRNFEYTRQQWTGKSPKQFLIDWVRKHLPKSPPPSYNKMNTGHNLWRSKCKVVRPDKNLEVVPDIVTENVKDAEHLASTLALYHLCKGQRVYQLLPPPYRDVWLDWQDAEDLAKKESVLEENKPRDQFVTKLLKKLKVEEGADAVPEEEPPSPVKVDEGQSVTVDEEEEKEDIEDNWEALASDEEEEVHQMEATPVPASSSGSQASLTKTSAPAHLPKFNLSAARRTFKERTSSTSYQDSLSRRKDLPVYPYRDEILSVINRKNVAVVAGETGSGKSTQIPQYILEDFLMSGSAMCNIVCTEPRRISAISLASRVSQELGEPSPGSRNTFCGYQIRFEAKKCETTRLLYCTTGVLLRKLQQDPLIRDVSHVIVDEVHERSVDSDFLLILLRQILQQRNDFKVLLMSATVDSEKFSRYFNGCPVFNIPGRTFPVEVFHLEDVVEMSNYILESDSPYALRENQLVEEKQVEVEVTGKGGDTHKESLSWSTQDMKTIDLSNLDSSVYSLKTRNTVTRMNPRRINQDLIVEVVKYIETSSQFSNVDGAILIFLPGLAHIQELYEMLTSERHFADKKRYRIIALHSVLSSEDQSAAFNIPPPGVRKIVIATNIAETGITIPDVVFVIDPGKAKENRYIETSQMSTLEEVFISKAASRQRQGRAGRVRDGFCFRLFTRHKFESFKAYSIPEILRVPLEELCLHIMKSERGNPAEFLGQALDAPQPGAISRAMSILREVGACEGTSLTPLGHHLAALPVNVRIGKMLVFGAIFGCLDAVSVIAATMTEKSPFASALEDRTQADHAKQSLAFGNSDQLTLYRAYLGWMVAKEGGRKAEMDYCRRYFLKRNTLLEIQNVSRDLVKLLHTIGFGQTHGATSKSTITSKDGALIKAVLTAGLYPHIGKVTFTPKVEAAAADSGKDICIVQTTQGPAAIHPSSVNRYLAINGFVVHHEKVRQNRVYVKDVSITTPYSLLLFGGNITVHHHTQQVTVDEWIKFKAYARTGVIFKELRHLIENLLERKLTNPNLNVSDEPEVKVLMDLITSEK